MDMKKYFAVLELMKEAIESATAVRVQYIKSGSYFCNAVKAVKGFCLPSAAADAVDKKIDRKQTNERRFLTKVE